MPESLIEVAGLHFFRLLLSLRRKPSRLAVLFYHRVPDDRDAEFGGDVGKSMFAAQMTVVKKYFNPLPLTEAVKLLKKDRLPPASISITFDDGYRDNYTNAAPVLHAAGIPATIFVAAGYMGNGAMWNDVIIKAIKETEKKELHVDDITADRLEINSDRDRKQVIDTLLSEIKYFAHEKREYVAEKIVEQCGVRRPADIMMTREQLKDLQGFNIDVGGHTCSHPILKSLTEEQVRKEILEGKERLEQVVGYRLDSFAYPNGNPGIDYTERDVSIVRESGFACAVSTKWGVADTATDIYQIPRLITWPGRPLRQGMMVLRELLG